MFPFFDKSSVKALALYACLVLVALQFAGCSSREQRAQSYYEHGMSLLEKQDFVKARIELRNAVQLKEDMVGAWRALAKIDEHDRNRQSLAGSLRRITELDSTDIDARARLARLLLLGGAFNDALKVANAASDINPQNASVLALKAAVLFKLNDADGATRTAQKALEIDPSNIDASVVLASIKFTNGDYDGALRVLANVPSAHEDDLGVIFLQLNILNRTGKLQQVESLLRKLITLYPKVPAYRTQLVNFYLTHKRPEAAEKELREVVAANPADSNSELELVNLLGAIKGLAAARTELLARINADEHVFPYQIALAKLDFAQGNVADSTKLLEKLISSSSSPDDILTARTTLSEMYLSKNNFSAAEPLVTDMLRADSRNVNSLRLRATIRINRGQFDDAIADLRGALNDQPQSPELLETLGLAYERNGSIDLAGKAYFDATKASRFAPVFGLDYVAFLRRRGLTAEAENALTELATRNPNNIVILSALAEVKLARQDWGGAHALADAIRRLGDKSNVADQINGAAFSGQKQFNDSIAALQNVYDANPGAVRPMAALVNEYLQAKQIDKAEAFLQAVLKANPQNAEALVLMGTIQLVKNDPNEATKDFQAAIKQQPNDIIGYRALAGLYARQNKIDDALKIIRAGLEQQPKSFDLHLTLAGMLETKGEYELAIAEYETMLKDQPGSMIVTNNLASLLADHRTDKASLAKAVSISALLAKSQVPQFKDTLGWIAYLQNDYTGAISLLEAAAAELANVPLVHYHLGMSYMANGQHEKGSEQFKKAQELAPNDAELKMKINAALKRSSEKAKG